MTAFLDDPIAAYVAARSNPPVRLNPQPGVTSRISLELPLALVDRLNEKAAVMRVQRRDLIEAVLRRAVEEMDRIDEVGS